ncbi:uncharacterized protein SPSK_10123 [Sporothrix schenckii 1099-18]|uniref:Uncharacterized protein n=1 Tax=Sporothrix schenckii 1099-18 TaxID=1397361 RepID=A0A0F2MA14_SPOSC|nr:uncharacterized protein SPSK_10123 [Sporothrix schenckii 1099-18]KJR84996.1 hypothetical protein SPSK_10123 [Sporothrix schenckii 1099-18]
MSMMEHGTYADGAGINVSRDGKVRQIEILRLYLILIPSKIIILHQERRVTDGRVPFVRLACGLRELCYGAIPSNGNSPKERDYNTLLTMNGLAKTD